MVRTGRGRPLLQAIVLLFLVASLLSGSWFVKFFNHGGPTILNMMDENRLGFLWSLTGSGLSARFHKDGVALGVVEMGWDAHTPSPTALGEESRLGDRLSVRVNTTDGQEAYRSYFYRGDGWALTWSFVPEPGVREGVEAALLGLDDIHPRWLGPRHTASLLWALTLGDFRHFQGYMQHHAGSPYTLVGLPMHLVRLVRWQPPASRQG